MVPLLSEQRSLAGTLQGFLGIDLQIRSDQINIVDILRLDPIQQW